MHIRPVIILGLLVLIILALVYYQREDESTSAWQSQVGESLPGQSPVGELQAEIVERLKPSVVSVWSSKDGKPLNQGSGFAVGKDGLILTNLHVLEDGDRLVVKFDAGISNAEYDAGIVASNEEYDLLLLMIDYGSLTPLPLGLDKARQGDKVWAMGFPSSQGLDASRMTVTSGIVSRINPAGNGMPVIIQTDAYMTYGSSGSALYDVDAGGVVGICSWSQHDEADRPLVGINYALAIEKVVEVFGEYL